MARPINFLNLSGDFSFGGGGNRIAWAANGPWGASRDGAPWLTDDTAPGVPMYLGLSGLNVGLGANGAGRVSPAISGAEDTGGDSFTISAVATPEITTDLADYAPGSTAWITMTGIEAGAAVRFEIDHVNDPGADGIWGTLDDVTYQLGGDGHDPWYVTDGGAGDLDGEANGVIRTSWYVNPDDSLDERFLLTGDVVEAGTDGVFGTADDVETGVHASNTFTDSGGDYSIDFSVGDPAQYERKRPSEFSVVPSGRANDPIPGANDGSANESLSPKELALGQVVPFEVEITTGNSATFTGTMEFTVAFGTETSNGKPFGFDESYGLFAAFVDGLDPTTTDADSTVSNISWFHDVANGEIVATITVTNLDPNTTSVVELWVVLDPTIADGTNGNVQSRLLSASEVGTGDTITTGNQTVPLLKVAEFLTGDADLSVVVSDEPADVNPVVGDDPEGVVRAGDQIVYTIIAQNNSTTTVANGVVLTDLLDANVDFVSATVDGVAVTGVYDSLTHTVTIDLGWLERVGDVGSNSATILITARVRDGVAPSTVLSNTASITSLTGEATAADNTNTEQTTLAANGSPDAIDDVLTISEDGPTGPIVVTANDLDPDATDDLEILSVDTTGTVGTVTVNPDGDTVAYDPNGQFESLAVGETALDTFTYTITDGHGGTDTATVTVTVQGANDGPNAVDDTASVDAGGAAISIDVLGNDTDPDASDVLTILSIDTTGMAGSVTVDDNGTPGDASDDTILYDPTGAFGSLGQGETALDTFSYTITDGNGGTDTATVTVTATGVNDPPVAVDDTTVGLQNRAVSYNVLVNDSDPNGDALEVLSATVTTPGAGTVVVNPDETLTFTPDPLTTGPVTIDYTISDGLGGTDAATLTVLLIPNGAPTISEPISFDMDENQTLAAALQATDPEGDTLTWSISGGPDAALFSIDADTGQLSFLAAPDFEAPLDQGADNQYNVTVTVADEFGSDTRGVLVTVLDVNDGTNAPPVILAPTAPPGLPAIFVLTALSQNVVGQVFAIDPDGDTLEYQLFGEDVDIFSINAATGEVLITDPGLTGQTLPASFDGDRIYELDILVLDGNGGSAVLDLDLPLFLGG